MKLSTLFSLVAITATLAACGGGGGDSPAATPPSGLPPAGSPPALAPAVASSGSVLAQFTKATNARFVIASVGLQSSGVLNSLVQDVTGSVSNINGSYTITGTPYAVQEISGDATYAQGRWNAGTVTKPSGTEVLNPASNQAYHYLVLNNLAAVPTTGVNKTCGTSRMTTPTFIGSQTTAGASAPNTGTATATGSISFNSNGANVTLVVDASSSGSNTSSNFSGIVATTTSTYVRGGLGGLGNSAQIMLGDGGGGAIIVGGLYSVVLGNGAVYQGVLSLKCV